MVHERYIRKRERQIKVNSGNAPDQQDKGNENNSRVWVRYIINKTISNFV